MLYLLILNNFASWTNAVNQIVNSILINMSKTYFCELVSGFFLNLDQTTVVIIYGRSR